MTERGYTYTEQYRHECEVRYVLALPTRAQRAQYIEGLARRGPAAVERMRRDVSDAWHASRSGLPWPHLPEGEAPAASSAAGVHPQVNRAPDSEPGHGSLQAAPVAGNSDPDEGVESGAAA